MTTYRLADPVVDLAQTDKPYQEEAVLRALYVDRGLKMEEIAERFGVARSTIVRWVNEHGIETRSSNDYGGETPWRDKDVMRHLYFEEGLKQKEIADELGCCLSTVEHWFRRHGLSGRDATDYAASRPASYFTDKNGYVVVADNHYQVRLHRLLAVAEYGFDAIRDKAVHHRNRIPWDNRPGNVEPLSFSEHAELHAEISPTWGGRNV